MGITKMKNIEAVAHLKNGAVVEILAAVDVAQAKEMSSLMVKALASMDARADSLMVTETLVEMVEEQASLEEILAASTETSQEERETLPLQGNVIPFPKA